MGLKRSLVAVAQRKINRPGILQNAIKKESGFGRRQENGSSGCKDGVSKEYSTSWEMRNCKCGICRRGA